MDIKEFFEKQNWIFAKTYAKKAPHEYIVRNNINGTDSEFMEAVDYIHNYGFTMYWKGFYANKYIYIDGYNYWVMMDGEDDPTCIINRSVAEDYWISVDYRPKQSV